MLAVKADLAKIVLTQPVCTETGEKIALSRRVEKHWRYVYVLLLGELAFQAPYTQIRIFLKPHAIFFLRNQLQMNERIHGLGVDKRLIRVKMIICTVSKVS